MGGRRAGAGAVLADRDAVGHLSAVSAGGEKYPDAALRARKLQALGPVTLPEKITLGVFALLLVLWAGIPAMIFGPALAVNPTTAALIGLAVLLATGVLSWEDVLKHCLGHRVWFSALVMMASFLGKLDRLAVANRGQRHRPYGHELGGRRSLTLIYLYSHYFSPAPPRT